MTILYPLVKKPVDELIYFRITHPFSNKNRKKEQMALSKAAHKWHSYSGRMWQTYSFGNGKYTLLCLGGWDSRLSYFLQLTHTLSLTHKIILLEFPDQRKSQTKGITPKDYVDIISEILTKLKIDGVITHCLGSLAFTKALEINPQIHVRKALLIASINSFSSYIDDLARRNDLPEALAESIKHKLTQPLGKLSKWKTEDVYAKISIQIAQTQLIHCIEDPVVPYSHSYAIYKKFYPLLNGQFIHGKSHTGILRDQRTLQIATDFFTEN